MGEASHTRPNEKTGGEKQKERDTNVRSGSVYRVLNFLCKALLLKTVTLEQRFAFTATLIL